MQTYQRHMTSPIGPLYMTATENALEQVRWGYSDSDSQKLGSRRAGKILDTAQKQLEEYFSGTRYCFDLPIHLSGTAFQMAVWNQLYKIPFASKCSYKQLALDIARPQACRAVGNANGMNPMCIIIPCHRVIASDGSLGGYSSGIKIKQQLLDLENRFKSGLADILPRHDSTQALDDMHMV